MNNQKWDLGTVENLIKNQIEENLHLEYKSAQSIGRQNNQTDEISKDISAFANSDGGIIIYGISEFNEKSKRHFPEKIVPINSIDYPKEWLEQIILSKIKPTIRNFEIKPIWINKHKNELIYIVIVQQSDTAHQAADKKYYKRYNFMSIAMEDYEIRDIMNRNLFPYLELKLIIEKEVYDEDDDNPLYGLRSPFHYSQKPVKKIERCQLKSQINNVGNIIAKYVNYYIYLPLEIIKKNDLLDYNIVKIDNKSFVKIYNDNTIRDYIKGGYMKPTEYGPSRFDPILPGMSSIFKKIELVYNIENYKLLSILWEIFSENPQPIKNEIQINDIEIIINDETNNNVV